MEDYETRLEVVKKSIEAFYGADESNRSQVLELGYAALRTLGNHLDGVHVEGMGNGPVGEGTDLGESLVALSRSLAEESSQEVLLGNLGPKRGEDISDSMEPTLPGNKE